MTKKESSDEGRVSTRSRMIFDADAGRTLVNAFFTIDTGYNLTANPCQGVSLQITDTFIDAAPA